MRRISGIGLATIAVMTLALGACGSSGTSDGDDSGSGGNDAAPSLDGTQWVLTAMVPAVAGTDTVAVSARFDAGVLSGHSGCNTYRTSYQQDGVELTIGQDIATTKIACPPEASWRGTGLPDPARTGRHAHRDGHEASRCGRPTRRRSCSTARRRRPRT